MLFGVFMNLKYVYIISVFLILLFAIPASFAFEYSNNMEYSINNCSYCVDGDTNSNFNLSSNFDSLRSNLSDESNVKYMYESDSVSNDVNLNCNYSPSISVSSIQDTSNEFINDNLNINSLNSINTNSSNFYLDSVSNLLYSNNDTIFVNSSYTGIDTYGTQENPFKTIEDGIESLLINDNYSNLFISNGNYTLLNMIELYAEYNRTINIIGESSSGTILNGKSKIAPFNIVSNLNINFINFTISNAYSKDYALINNENDSSNIQLINLIFKNNKCNSPGGIIYSSGGSLLILNVSVYNNLIDYDDGLSGAIICDLGGNLNIMNSTFFNNTIRANTSSGAFIYASASNVYNQFNIINSTIYNNTIGYSIMKGPIVFANGFLIFNLINSSIINNTINGSSSESLVLTNGLYYFDNSTIVNNSILNLTKYDDLELKYNYILINNPFNITVSLPVTFDLRNVNGTSYLTSVKNQGGYNTCWTFATCASLESYILRFENMIYDISEANMANVMSNLNKVNGSLWSIKDGGNFMLALAYLLRWDGFVNESEDNYSNIGGTLKFLSAIKHVQDIAFIPYRLNFTANDQIKYAILNYGGVVSSIYWGSRGTSSYYNGSNSCNHAITIVGWDDNYSKTNFSTNPDNQPPGDGAFIIKNSWGASAGDNGYYYISYYDTSLGMSDSIFGFVPTNIENTTNYEDIYQYDLFGNTNIAAGYLNETGWMANQFDIINNNPIAAFGIYVYGSSIYDVTVYINGKKVYCQNGSISGSGYHTIKFNNLIKVSKGDLFRIEIKLNTPNCLYPIAIEGSRNGFIITKSANNQSFVSNDGVNWVDLNSIYPSINPNVCIKLYSGRNLTVDFVSNVSYCHNGDLVSFNLTLDNYLNSVNSNLTFVLDGFEINYFNVNIGTFNNETKTWTLENLSHDDYAKLELILIVNSDNTFSYLNFTLNSPSYGIIDDNYSFNLVKYEKYVVINASDLVVEYNSTSYFSASLKNLTNSSVENVSVVFEIYDSNGNLVANYTDLSDCNGFSKFLIDFNYINIGNYTVYAKVLDPNIKSNEVNSKLIVSPIAIDIKLNQTTTIVYGADGFCSIFVHKNNLPIVGVNMSLEIWTQPSKDPSENICNYSTLTDDDGYAKFYINLASGNYDLFVHVLNNTFKINNEPTNPYLLKILKANATFVVSNISAYYKGDNFLLIKLINNVNNTTSKGFADVDLLIYINSINFNKTYKLTTDANGSVNINISSLVPGKYNVAVQCLDENINVENVKSNIEIKKTVATIIPTAFSSYYNSGAYFKVKLIDNNTKKVLSGVKLKLAIYTGNTYKTVYITTNKNGIAQWKVNSLAIGSHKVYINVNDSYITASKVSSTITVTRVPTTVYAPKVTSKYKSNKNFKVLVKNSKTLKIISGLKLKLRIYTGRYYKTVYVKTNSKGIAYYNLKYLSIGNHKIVIGSANNNYYVKVTSYVIIKR